MELENILQRTRDGLAKAGQIGTIAAFLASPVLAQQISGTTPNKSEDSQYSIQHQYTQQLDEETNNHVNIAPIAKLSVLVNSALPPNATAIAAAAGSLGTIYGENLSGTGEACVATQLPLPKELCGTSVYMRVAGSEEPWEAQPLTFVNAGQINTLTLGNPGAQEKAEIQVATNGLMSETLEQRLPLISPQFFTYLNGIAAANITDPDTGETTLHGPGNVKGTTFTPARQNSILTAYVTGIGPLTEQIPNDLPVGRAVWVQDLENFKVYIDGTEADILYLGASPQFPGVYQLNTKSSKPVRDGALALKLCHLDICSDQVTYLKAEEASIIGRTIEPKSGQSTQTIVEAENIITQQKTSTVTGPNGYFVLDVSQNSINNIQVPETENQYAWSDQYTHTTNTTNIGNINILEKARLYDDKYDLLELLISLTAKGGTCEPGTIGGFDFTKGPVPVYISPEVAAVTPMDIYTRAQNAQNVLMTYFTFTDSRIQPGQRGINVDPESISSGRPSTFIDNEGNLCGDATQGLVKMNMTGPDSMRWQTLVHEVQSHARGLYGHIMEDVSIHLGIGSFLARQALIENDYRMTRDDALVVDTLNALGPGTVLTRYASTSK